MTTVEDLILRHDVEMLLYHEVRLLDEGRFDDWLELYTEDARYVVPIGDRDDDHEPAVIDDSRQRMGERVFRLTETLVHAQNPPSRTQHEVTNVDILERSTETIVVGCNQTVHEIRGGDIFHVGLGSPRSFHARVTYRLVNAADGWRIALKSVVLLDRDMPLGNLVFII
ncbi:aromatic-ring-hydroxylating dioxygenase subunit beta [Actinophytocola sp.]|uniref:aromatic-ring-hydroxylating dioxygenase subunit beta n=1 Tax=Actinophytocola sp. TaxID=1872138 RepID=UPI003D6A5571